MYFSVIRMYSIILCILILPSLHGQTFSEVRYFPEGRDLRIEYALHWVCPVDVQLYCSRDEGSTYIGPLQQVRGDVGKDIASGSKEIIWRKSEEAPEWEVEGLLFRLEVDWGPWRKGMLHCKCIPTEIVEVRNPVTGRVWMDRNLGASRPARGKLDSLAFGDLYQWGRFGDGHQCRNSKRTNSLSETDNPGHGRFIVNINKPYDWRNPHNAALWQKESDPNNPCPKGYRIPTASEWEEEYKSWLYDNHNGAIHSPLKLPVAGRRSGLDGMYYAMHHGHYWSSSLSGFISRLLDFNPGHTFINNLGRGNGHSVRCIQD
jgi:hypothetical protein